MIAKKSDFNNRTVYINVFVEFSKKNDTIIHCTNGHFINSLQLLDIIVCFFLWRIIIRRCLHFSSSVSISINPNEISIVRSSKVSVPNSQMDVDTDSSSIMAGATSLELNNANDEAFQMQDQNK